MNPKTRYNIRLSQRKGITIREGTSSDIATFHRLLVATSKRQHFVTDSEAYFSSLWNIFSAHGYIKLLLAEYEGDVVSAFLEIPFGETVVYKRGAWSGLQGNRHPNEGLHWTAITWAKSQGYRYYDFDGIHPGVAQAIVQGETLPAEAVKTVASFKLGFGGEVVLLPVYDYIYNPLLRWGYNAVFPRIRDSALINKALQHVRSRTKNTG
jgi:peptidoglycan pentaglycine glycine transferase (the first glycine)